MKNTEKKEGKDMENMAENSDKIWTKRKTDKLNIEMILKIWKKVVKRFGKYRRKL